MKNSSIVSVSVVVALLVGVGKLLAFIKDIVISGRFGATLETDAFFVANSIPGLIFIGFFSTVSLVFLPIYTEVLKERGKDEAFKYTSNTLANYAVVSLMLTILGAAFAPFLVKNIAPSLPSDTLNLAVKLTRVVCLSFVFSISTSIFSSVQYVHGKYFGPQLIPILNNLIIILSVLLFAEKFGIYSVAVASLVGWVLQLPLQRYLTGKDFRYTPILNFNDEAIKKMGALVLPAFIGVSVDQMNVIIDNYLGSGLNEGSISALNYGVRLMNLLGGIFIVVISSILYPKFSDFIVKGDTKRLNKIVGSSLKFFTLIIVPIILISFVYHYEVISIIFERGAFDKQDALLTSQVFLFYIVGLIFVLVREVFNKVFYAYQDAKTPLYISLVAIIVNIVMSIILVRSIGVAGLALATSISIAVYVFVQLFFIRKKIGSLFLEEIGTFASKVAISSFGMILGVWSFHKYVLVNSILLDLVLGSIVGVMIFGSLLAILKLKEFLIAQKFLFEFVKAKYRK